MDLSAPFQAMFPTVDSSVLAVLAGSKEPRSGREVARQANRSQRATKLVLDRLVDHGLVLRQEVGRSQSYTLNWSHLAAEPLIQLVNLRPALFARLREAFAEWRLPPVHVSVFGSAARGDGDIESDVDIFLVRPGNVDEGDEEWREKVRALAEAIFEWTGNHAGIAEVGEDDVERLRQERPAVVENLQVDAIDIVGIPIRRLLRRM